MSIREFKRYLPWRRKDRLPKPPRLVVTREVLDAIVAMASSSPSLETGGILIGHHSGSDVQIVKATDAGPSSHRSACNFTRDTKHCQDVLEHEFQLTGADYVGEWHSHVLGPSGPSTGDLRTLARIVLDPEYNFLSFVMILAVLQRGQVELSSYVVTKASDPREGNAWIVTVAQVEPEGLETVGSVGH